MPDRPTPEQRAEWKNEALLGNIFADSESVRRLSDRVLALLDALEEMEKAVQKWKEYYPTWLP